MEIVRWKQASTGPVTRDGEDSHLRTEDTKETEAAESLKVGQHATIERTDTTPPVNIDITT